MKKFLALILALCMILGASAALADPVTLVYAEVNPPQDCVVGDVAMAFKQKVEELSGGEIIIDVQANGVLGTEAQVLDSILGGGTTIDISRISAFALNSYGCKKSQLLSLPFIWANRDHYYNFVNSDLAASFLNEPQEIGLPLRGLFYAEEGFRHFFFTKEVKSIEDMKGMKIRVSEDPIMTGMVTSLGANPTVVGFTELYSALQTGVVDGAEQPISNYRSNAFPEVAPYMILDGHTLGAIEIVITDSGWAKLNEQQQGWIMEAASYTANYAKERSNYYEGAVRTLLEEEGRTVIDVDDVTPWYEACSAANAQFIAGQEDLYQQILDQK